jgi:chemotaxis protein CheY-P-specific phosphatase CheC
MINTENLLIEAISCALEKMAFMAIGPVEEDLVPPQDILLSEIHFTGPNAGTLQILAGTDFARLLAENMSAGQDTDTDACLDVFRELSNVTCGLVLPVLCRSQEDIFDITVPTVAAGQETPAWNEFTADQNCIVLNVENNLIAIKLICQRQLKEV